MSGSENGEPGMNSSPGRSTNRVGARAASPAKRTAAEMEDVNNQQGTSISSQPSVPGSFSVPQDDTQTDFDIAMAGMTPAPNGLDTQETVVSSLGTSAHESSSSTSATSFETDTQHMADDSQLPAAHKEPYSTERIDQQYDHVSGQMEKPIGEGDRGVIISQKWLNRVMSRTTEGLKSGIFPKTAREGIVGPVDNSDIVADRGLDEPYLHDTENQPFVPLKPGLTMNEDYRVVPHDAYNFIMGEYGYKLKHPIVRYAHDTTQGESAMQNFQYEIYPPTITIRKVSSGQSSKQPAKHPTSATALRMKKAREARGQRTDDDAIRLVSSRSEHFQKFLSRSKEAAGIPQSTKVKLWRLTNPTSVSAGNLNESQTGVLALPSNTENRSAIAAAGRPTDVSLVLGNVAFDKMQLGVDLELIDAKDETGNDKYNGRSTMETFALNTDQTIVLEEQLGGPGGGEFQSDSKRSLQIPNSKLNGSKSGSAPTSGRTSPVPGGIMTRGRARRDGRTRGTVGLSNLGNTCYMNSALQCIRSVEELAVFFVSNGYKKEINNDNPLGHHGAMANAYANVLRGIYSPTATGSFSPNEFKKRLGNSQPLFSGYGQQDSQEFLSFLVDALHEDLNRIKKKPYNENPDSDDNTVHDPQAIVELGEIYRKNHRARNDSVAMDLFSGFYKNTMECPVCDKISITFDPYSLLTVQLPIENAFTHTVTFIPLNGKPVNHTIDIDKNATIKSVKEAIAKKHPGVTADRMWMVEVYSHKIYRVFEDNSTLAEANIVPNDYIFMYELDSIPKNIASPKKQAFYSSYYKSNSDDSIPLEGMDSPKADCMAVPVFNRFKNTLGNHSVAMHPLYITLTPAEAGNYTIILKKVLMAVAKITSRPILTEFGQEEPQKSRSPAIEVGQETPTGDDSVGVSDHSTPSEDGYVNVSLGKTLETAKLGSASPMHIDNECSAVPDGFMDPSYYIDPSLSLQLFDMKVAKSADNMHCASMASFSELSVRLMYDRVKTSARRSSVHSTSSDDSSSATGSDEPVNVTNDESDEDDSDKPDTAIEESSLSSRMVQDSDDDELSSSAMFQPMNNPRSGRRRVNRGKKERRGKRGGRATTYSHKDRARHGQNRVNGDVVSTSKHAPEDGQFYVEIGEAIVLDWQPDAVDALFKGNPEIDGDLRGHRLTTDDGRQMEFFHDPELIMKKKKREERKRHGIDLEDCFVETGKREVLSEDNAWYCNRCKEMRRAAKTLEIWTIPDILVVHLKRFGGNRSFRDKIDVLVDYPVTGLDMTDKVGLKEEGKEYIYDLFAVDNHYGGLGGGHYTAMAKNFYDGQWYDYNDSSCSKIGNEAKLQSAAAYLLFYRRRSASPLGPQYLQELVNEARNPTPTDPTTDDAEDADSGEGRLGGPTLSSLHGSSSGSAAGVVGMNSSSSNNNGSSPTKGLGSVGGGAAARATADNRLILRQTTTTTNNNRAADPDEDFSDFVSSSSQNAPPPPPLYRPHSSSQEPLWSFDSLNPVVEHDDEEPPSLTRNFLSSIGGGGGGGSGGVEDLDDTASTTAELDRDSAYGDSSTGGHIDFMDDDNYSDAREHNEYPSSSMAGRSSPVLNSRFVEDVDEEEEEEHGRRRSPSSSSLHRHHHMFADAAEHVEDAGMGGVEDPPPVEIHVDGDGEGDGDGRVKID